MNSAQNSGRLFQFKLAPLEVIKPWSDADGKSLSLSLFALTDGHFRISVGKEQLLRYTPAIISRWGLTHEDADYQVAGFARDVLDPFSAIISPIPAFFENLIRNEPLLRQLKSGTYHTCQKIPAGVIDKLEVGKTNVDFDECLYDAFRWQGERSVWLNYLGSAPDIWFVRVGNEVWIQWDNTNSGFEGIEVWTAGRGKYSLSVEEFVAECHSFSDRLLSAMETRIESIENGSARAQIPLDTASLRNQLLEFKKEFEKSLSATYQSDIAWETAEKAMRTIASEIGVSLPSV